MTAPGTSSQDEPKKRKRRVDANTWLLLGLTVLAFAVAYRKDPSLPEQGVRATGKMLSNVGIELALGFLLAGIIDVLIPARVLSSYLGGENLGRGILVGWGVGLLVPGGPYVLFPMAASLLKNGAAAGPLITLLTAKTLVSPLRMLTYEAPLLGWPMTAARLIPGVLVSPLLGLAGHYVFGYFSGARN
jgi:uncharacterized membrane protein YraQ (UPF0718 family)